MADEPEIRLLVCGKCKTVEELPDYKGPTNRDVMLNVAVNRHKDGATRTPHAPAQLLRAKVSDWSKSTYKEEILKQINATLNPNSSTTGLPSEAYAMADNFKADALACFARHNRNPNCPDYKTDKMRLVPDTKTERKEMGLDPRYDAGDPGLTKYLCEYCPVHSLVQQAARKAAGLYDK